MTDDEKRIVELLRTRALPHRCTADQDIADAIERGEHRKD